MALPISAAGLQSPQHIESQTGEMLHEQRTLSGLAAPLHALQGDEHVYSSGSAMPMALSRADFGLGAVFLAAERASEAVSVRGVRMG